MTTSKVISWLEDLLPEIKRTGAPEQVMLKFANDNNLAPAQLEKLAHVFNSAKTLSYLEKSAGRGVSFHVVDADELVKKYVGDAPKAAQAINEWVDAPATKSAALTAPIAERWPKARVQAEPALESYLGPKAASAKAILRERSEAKATAQNYRQVVFDLGEDVNDLTVKLAEQMRVVPDFDFARVEAEALGLHGAGIKSACDLVSRRLQRCRFVHKRASTPASGLVRDSHGFIEGFKKLAQALELHETARKLEAEYVKSAAAVQAPDRDVETLDKPKSEPREKKEPQAPKEKSKTPASPVATPPPASKPSGVFDTLSKIPAPAAPVEPVTLMQNLVREALPTKNTGQQLVDREHDDLQSQIVVERLLMTDPILSDADPHLVVSLANSIREQAPHVARDINAMRFALREAVQYQALPTHTVKDLAGVQKTRVETESTEAANAKDRYAQGPRKETKK